MAQPVLLTRAAQGRLQARAANDNGDAARHELVLRAALKHFAAHGLRAAEDAAERAAVAHRTGKGEDMLHWLEICRTLDPRRAARVNARLARGND
ncbi:MAG: hypothetical protein C0515_11830 [Novosphingobium sp.]|nr:hypothetical protein [Novosphingobium sp.]